MALNYFRKYKKGEAREQTIIIYRTAHYERVKNKAEILATSQIDNKHDYNTFSQTWIQECPKVNKISDRIINFITEDNEKLKSGINSRWKLKVASSW